MPQPPRGCAGALDVAGANGFSRLGERRVDAGIDGRLGDSRPMHLGGPIIKADAARRVVVRDDEEGMEM
jgi:hypothetical protein